MGAKVTTEIDPRIKHIWEGMKDILGITYREILEEGILAKIMDIDPVQAEEIEIKRLEFQLSAHREHLATLKVNNQHVNEKIAAAQRINGIEIERQEWFKKKAEWLVRMVDKDIVPWKSIAEHGPFNNVKEAKEWVLNHLPEWRQAHEEDACA